MPSTLDEDERPTEPTDEDSFTRALTDLIQRAREHGVTVEGAWTPTTASDGGDRWDVVIVPVPDGDADAADTTDEGTGPFTVLLVEDDEDFRETIRYWLGDDGRWNVRMASDGAEALELLDDTVDVLVVDRHLPTVSGTEVVDRLDETSFDGSVVVLSAYEPNGHLNEDDVAAYLTKPIDREMLVGALDDLCGR